MLIRSSCALQPEIYQFTLGGSCHYLVGTKEEFVLFDPGLSAHIPALLKRINDSQFSIKNCKAVLTTHLHATRVGGIALLRKLNPEIALITSASMKLQLSEKVFIEELFSEDQKLTSLFELERDVSPLSLKEFSELFKVSKSVSDGDNFSLNNEISLRTIAFPGHTKESLGFVIDPYNFLIADEGAGFYNGKNLAGPGCDYSIDENIKVLKRLLQLNIEGLCLPFVGTLTALLVRKHFSSLIQNIEDLVTEVKLAKEKNISEDEIKAQIERHLYQTVIADPLLRLNIQKSIEAIMKQL